MFFNRGFSTPALLMLLFFSLIPPAEADEPLQVKALDQDMCVICHDSAPADINSAGGAHKEMINCIDCHDGHPPRQMEIIPSCGNCHSGEDHFTLADCFSCHSNPHRPLDIQIGKNVTEACITCHEEPGLLLSGVKTRHSVMACSSCHQKTHGVIPNCLQCHKSHSPDMAEDSCSGCHQAHQPMPPVFATNNSSSQCFACHDLPVKLLAASTSKHADLRCTTCHQGEHRVIPSCQQCHNQPHWSTLEEKFPECLTCHFDPHDLPQ